MSGEGIDYEETFAPVPRLEAIRMFSLLILTKILYCIKWMRKCILKWLYYGGSLCRTTSRIWKFLFSSDAYKF